MPLRRRSTPQQQAKRRLTQQSAPQPDRQQNAASPQSLFNQRLPGQNTGMAAFQSSPVVQGPAPQTPGFWTPENVAGAQPAPMPQPQRPPPGFAPQSPPGFTQRPQPGFTPQPPQRPPVWGPQPAPRPPVWGPQPAPPPPEVGAPGGGPFGPHPVSPPAGGGPSPAPPSQPPQSGGLAIPYQGGSTMHWAQALIDHYGSPEAAFAALGGDPSLIGLFTSGTNLLGIQWGSNIGNAGYGADPSHGAFGQGEMPGHDNPYAPGGIYGPPAQQQPPQQPDRPPPEFGPWPAPSPDLNRPPGGAGGTGPPQAMTNPPQPPPQQDQAQAGAGQGHPLQFSSSAATNGGGISSAIGPGTSPQMSVPGTGINGQPQAAPSGDQMTSGTGGVPSVLDFVAQAERNSQEALAAAGVQTRAAPSPAFKPEPAEKSPFVPQDPAQNTPDFWTPEKIAEAKPAPMPDTDRPRGGAPPEDDDPLALPLSPEFERARRALEDQLAASLAGIGAQRDQIPGLVELVTQRLATDQAETERMAREAANARGVFDSTITRDDLTGVAHGFSRQRQDLASDVARQYADLASQESGAHGAFNKSIADLYLAIAASEAGKGGGSKAPPEEEKPDFEPQDPGGGGGGGGGKKKLPSTSKLGYGVTKKSPLNKFPNAFIKWAQKNGNGVQLQKDANYRWKLWEQWKTKQVKGGK